MKRIILLTIGMAFSTLLFAQTAVKGPVMTFETKTHDFGDVKQGDKVSYIFTYTNTGSDTLRIDNVVSSCGCTVPNSFDKKVAPGTKASITVEFNSAGKMGVVNKTLTILSNAVTSNGDPAEFINIRVNVIP